MSAPCVDTALLVSTIFLLFFSLFYFYPLFFVPNVTDWSAEWLRDEAGHVGGSGREWKRGNCGILLGLSWFTEWVEVEEDLGLSEVVLGCEKA